MTDRTSILQETERTEVAVLQRRLAGRLKRITTRPKLIDLFCGAGGMTLGFTGALGHAFEPVWANDMDQSAVETYNSNFGSHAICGDIDSILKDGRVSIPKADVVIGGPPCQGFSLLNKNREGDQRKQLWRPFLEIVSLSSATVFVMENVPQLIGSMEHEQIVEEGKLLGFRMAHAILSAADYGAPQTRRRAFILGCKTTDPNTVFPPLRTHYNPRNGSRTLLGVSDDEYIHDAVRWRTVRDAISDLESPNGTEIGLADVPYDLHFGRNPTPKSMARYRAIPKEGMNRVDLKIRAPELTPPCWLRKKSGGTDLFGRLWWDRPAFTIRTEFFKPEKGRYLHPVEHRPITHREAARFQSFPDQFKFHGSKVEVARQIGNAVPPVLAARVADSVLALLASRGKDCG